MVTTSWQILIMLDFDARPYMDESSEVAPMVAFT